MRTTQLLTLFSVVSFFDVVSLFDLGWSKSQKKILMSEVKVLTFDNKTFTTRQRSSPVPQLICTGGCSSGYKPETASCVNMDFDGYDAQWDCRADMPSEYSFGNIDVSCEGYDYLDDPYTLVRSCGLSYSLKKDDCSADSDLFGTAVWFVMIGLVCYGIYKICTENRQSECGVGDVGGGNKPSYRQSGYDDVGGGGGGNRQMYSNNSQPLPSYSGAALYSPAAKFELGKFALDTQLCHGDNISKNANEEFELGSDGIAQRRDRHLAYRIAKFEREKIESDIRLHDGIFQRKRILQHVDHFGG